MSARSLAGPARPQVPARWTAWLIWRQQRSALVLITGLTAATCVFLVRAGLVLEHGSGAQENGLRLLGFVLLAIPAVVGMLAGAPLLAREHQTGAIRYIRAQGLSPDRWLAGTLILTGTVIAAQAICVGVLYNWVLSLQGYQPELIFNNTSDTQFPTFPAWCVFAYALGVACGALTRRTLPAIGAFLLCYCGVAWPVMRILRHTSGRAGVLGTLSRRRQLLAVRGRGNRVPAPSGRRDCVGRDRHPPPPQERRLAPGGR